MDDSHKHKVKQKKPTIKEYNIVPFHLSNSEEQTVWLEDKIAGDLGRRPVTGRRWTVSERLRKTGG